MGNWDPLSIFSTPSTDSTQHIKIAVMGGTGCGKTTFINLVAGSNLGVSSGLASCTQDIQEANLMLDGRTIDLIDTPGFDDTHRSDVEILKLIADFLAERYKNNDQLHGILYFHRICDIRMGGASKRSFGLFRKLCGTRTLENVVIVTNMWDKVTTNEGETRENELLNDDKFFKPALDDGARTFRHHNTLFSAREMLRLVCDKSRLTVSNLDIQTEVVDDGKELIVTGAGQELESGLRAEAKGMAKIMEILKMNLSGAKNQDDEKTTVELQEELATLRRKFAHSQNELANLKAGFYNKIDTETMWKTMSREARVTLTFRRSIGAQDTTERFIFWAALGDTTRASTALDEIFSKHPIPDQLYNALFNQDYYPNGLTPELNRDLGAWIKGYPNAVKEIEIIMEKVIKKAKKQKKSWWSWGRSRVVGS